MNKMNKVKKERRKKGKMITKRIGVEKRVKVFIKDGEKKTVDRMVRESIRELDRIYEDTELSVELNSERKREERRNELKPVIETKSIKRSGIAHQVPTPVNDQRGLYRVCNWIREATRKRAKKRGVPLKTARKIELIAVYDERRAVKNGNDRQNFTTFPLQIRDRRHRTAKANRVFAKDR